MDYTSYSRGFDDGALMARRSTVVTAPFLVFADKVGMAGPTFKHPTRAAAETEAKRLANLNPGTDYFVVGSVSITNAPKPSASTRSLI